MSCEYRLELQIGKLRFTTVVRQGPDGSVNWFPFPEPPQLRRLHFSLHGGTDKQLRRADPRTVRQVIRTVRELIPYKVHAKVGPVRLPRSLDPHRLEHMFALWNFEQWDEEEFLLMLPDVLTRRFRPEVDGRVLRLRIEPDQLLKAFVSSLRVVGGREVVAAKESSKLRQGAVLHPRIGVTMFPLVLRFGGQEPVLGIDDDVQARAEMASIVTDIEPLTQNLQGLDDDAAESALFDALAHNREVMSFLLRLAAREVRGSTIAPRKPIQRLGRGTSQ